MSDASSIISVGGDVNDMWDDLARATADAEARREVGAERERQAVAQLLLARGHHLAAALVAVSGYRSDCVDNWDGGQYEVTLLVPAGQYDVVDDDVRAAIMSAAAAVTGEGHFSGLIVAIRLPDHQPGWDEELLRTIFSERQQSGTALPVGAADATDARR